MLGRERGERLGAATNFRTCVLDFDRIMYYNNNCQGKHFLALCPRLSSLRLFDIFNHKPLSLRQRRS
jgi:hypothetical protein